MTRRTVVLFLILAGPAAGTSIEQALAAGELDQETALLYRVYAVHAPESLPARFQDAPALPFALSRASPVTRLSIYTTDGQRVRQYEGGAAGPGVPAGPVRRA